MLDFEPDAVPLPRGHYIGGQHVDAGAPLTVLRPCDMQTLGSIPEASDAVIDQAVQTAHDAQRASGWGACPPRERARVLRRWADLLDTHTIELAQLEAVGSTRPVFDAHHHEVPFTAECIRFFAECADKFGGDVVPTRHDSLGLIMAEPYGVVGAITPWNFPLSMASWKAGPALAAGNAIVIKPSEFTPFSTVRFAELAVEAGVPTGVINVVQGRGVSAGAALVRHPLIRKVSFTGSSATGAAIMADVAHHGMKPVTLELGGKSPQLVYDDAGDLVVLAERIVRGFTSNAGQACVSGSRLIVQRGIAERLVDAVVTLVSQKTPQFLPGLTWRAASRYAPLINKTQAEKVHGLVQDALAHGAQARCGADFFADGPGGHFYQPTVLTNVQDDMCAVREEIFGPVLTVQVFDDEEEGLALADHTVYGLAACVHTQNIALALRAARRLAAGTVWINRYGRTGDFIIPTGGFKGSGIGKDLGRQAFEANLQTKSVLIDF